MKNKKESTKSFNRCKLCGEEKSLQRKCHIYSDFLFENGGLFHEHHSLRKINLNQSLQKGKLIYTSKNQKSGEYDEYSFCSNCDGSILGSYETYANEFLLNNNTERNRVIFNYTVLPNGQEIKIFDIDYIKLKLFFLSLLWRASISERPFFSDVKLEKNIEEELRSLLLNGSFIDEDKFPIIISSTAADITVDKGLIVSPIKGHNSYLMFLPGFLVTIFTGKNEALNILTEDVLKEDGSLTVNFIPPGGTIELLLQNISLA